MPYLNYIKDEDLLNAVGVLYSKYEVAFKKNTPSSFLKNKLDIIKFRFDSGFLGVDDKHIIETEILRKIDKSVNNHIGTFHEMILGSIEGYQRGNKSGFDIKADDDSLFAEIKNKHNTMNSSSAESVYKKLAGFADKYKVDCYLVQILAEKSFDKQWNGDINGKQYNHTRVRIISGDLFYARLTQSDTAFYDLYNVLPTVINDYMARYGNATFDREGQSITQLLNNIIGASDMQNIIKVLADQSFDYYKGFSEE